MWKTESDSELEALSWTWSWSWNLNWLNLKVEEKLNGPRNRFNIGLRYEETPWLVNNSPLDSS